MILTSPFDGNQLLEARVVEEDRLGRRLACSFCPSADDSNIAARWQSIAGSASGRRGSLGRRLACNMLSVLLAVKGHQSINIEDIDTIDFIKPLRGEVNSNGLA